MPGRRGQRAPSGVGPRLQGRVPAGTIRFMQGWKPVWSWASLPAHSHTVGASAYRALQCSPPPPAPGWAAGALPRPTELRPDGSGWGGVAAGMVGTLSWFRGMQGAGCLCSRGGQSQRRQRHRGSTLGGGGAASCGEPCPACCGGGEQDLAFRGAPHGPSADPTPPPGAADALGAAGSGRGAPRARSGRAPGPQCHGWCSGHVLSRAGPVPASTQQLGWPAGCGVGRAPAERTGEGREPALAPRGESGKG